MTYVVKSGDTLSSILKRFNVPGWNTPAVWNKIAPQLRSKNPSRVYPGEVINLSSVLPQTKATTTTPTPTPTTTTPRPVLEAQSAATAAPQLDFREVMPWEQFFDPNLALSSAAQRAAGYYTPMLQRGRENVESDFASRGLTRSSQRGKSVMD